MLPYLTLTGSWREQGEAHGRGAPDRIRHNVGLYMERFTGDVGLTEADVYERAGFAWRAVERAAPEYRAGVEGIARGAGVPLRDVVMLNMRYEIMYSRLSEVLREAAHEATSSRADDPSTSAEAAGSVSAHTAKPGAGESPGAPGECTAFGVEAAATSGGTLMGQNWDWIPDVAGLVLRVRGPHTTVLCFTEAGIFGGKIGVNGHGIGLAVSGLTSTADDWRHGGEPFHVRTWRVLLATSLDAAEAAVTAGTHSCAANFVLGRARGRVVSLETAPGITHRLAAEDHRLVHTNHFVDPAAAGVTEPANPRRAQSRHRRARLTALLGDPRPLGVSRIQGFLRDHDGHPDSVCRHRAPAVGQPVYRTVASAVLELEAQRMWITDGPPCRADYQAFELAVPTPTV